MAIIGSYLGAFWLASFLGDWFIAQMLMYIGFFCVVTWVALRHDIKELVVVANGIRSQPRWVGKG